jgi:hypothetical protein
VAVKVPPANSRLEEYPPLGAGVSGPETARMSRLPTAVVTRSGLMMRCSICAVFTSAPYVPVTVRVLPLRTESNVTMADEVVVSPVSPSGKVIVATSPGLMSGVTLSPVPAPQQ